MACCTRGPCALHLAEGDARYSTLIHDHGLVLVPDFDRQQLVGAFTRALIEWRTGPMTTSYPFVDPGEPGDLQSSLKATELINKPCLIRVTGAGEWPARAEERHEDGSVKERAQGPRPYLECDVVVLGMGGIEDHGSGVRISWVRVLPQLDDRQGVWVAARPKKQDDNSIVLFAFNEDGKAKAAEMMPQVEALFGSTPTAASAPPADFGDEPF